MRIVLLLGLMHLEIFAATTKQLPPEHRLLLEEGKTLEQVQLFHSAVETARRSSVAQDPALKLAQDKLLYRAFLERSLTEQGHALEPTPAELKAGYSKQPMLRFNHLILSWKTPEERRKIDSLLRQIQFELKRNVPFTSLVAKYSMDQNAPFGGDSDFRGEDSLPRPIYQTALTLKEKEISRPIYLEQSIHLLELVKIRSYEDCPSTYLANLSMQLKAKKEQEFLNKKLSKLDGVPAP